MLGENVRRAGWRLIQLSSSGVRHHSRLKGSAIKENIGAIWAVRTLRATPQATFIHIAR
ncbi:hypothetical protein D3C71_2204200 [compost metagenome]